MHGYNYTPVGDRDHRLVQVGEPLLEQPNDVMDRILFQVGDGAITVIVDHCHQFFHLGGAPACPPLGWYKACKEKNKSERNNEGVVRH